ncbi:hypothetical protein DFS34DRAFT_89951 [Phlyctochytrium arcticum]|nr:hypothetical protein DFS34DRAFT_89951 [Phlyctochytrium arcticum]
MACRKWPCTCTWIGFGTSALFSMITGAASYMLDEGFDPEIGEQMREGSQSSLGPEVSWRVFSVLHNLCILPLLDNPRMPIVFLGLRSLSLGRHPELNVRKQQSLDATRHAARSRASIGAWFDKLQKSCTILTYNHPTYTISMRLVFAWVLAATNDLPPSPRRHTWVQGPAVRR